MERERTSKSRLQRLGWSRRSPLRQRDACLRGDISIGRDTCSKLDREEETVRVQEGERASAARRVQADLDHRLRYFDHRVK